MSVYAYNHLTTPKNTNTGVAEYFYFAPVSWFVPNGIKCPKGPFANPGDEVRVLEAHEFIANKGFVKVQLAPEKNKLDAKTIGDLMFQKLDLSYECFIPGSYAEEHEMVKNMINTPLIVIVPESDCQADDKFFQLGCDCLAAYFKADFTTSTTKEGVKGYSCIVSWQNPYLQYYSHVDGPEILV